VNENPVSAPCVSGPLVNAPVVSGPLNGRRILLTRAKPDDAIARALRLAGAHVDALVLTVSTPLESARLDAARDRLPPRRADPPPRGGLPRFLVCPKPLPYR